MIDKLGARQAQSSTRRLLIAIHHLRGMSNGEIAAKLGLSPQTVSAQLNSAPVKKVLGQLRDDLAKRAVKDTLEMIERAAPKAVKVLEESLEHGENYTVKQRGADLLLDRHPQFAKRTRHEEERVVRISFTENELAQLGRAVPLPADDVIDMESLDEPEG